MVHVHLTIVDGKRLGGLVMHGHVGPDHGKRGENVVCAAVTALVRSCAEAIVGNNGIEALGGAEKAGEFELTISSVNPLQSAWLQGVTDVLVGGLRRIEQEASQEIELLLTRTGKKQERVDGT